jgi:GcrA cell cycle regulator
MSWTDERVEQLKTLWSEGHSASHIAKTLGNVTRNAVIGKIHRLGLSNRTSSASPKQAESSAPEQPDQTTKAATTPVEPEIVNTPEQTKSSKPSDTSSNLERIKKAAKQQLAEKKHEKLASSQPQDDEDISEEEDVPTEVVENEDELESVARAVALAKVEARSLKLSLMDLTERTCKWPIGDPATNDFYFCGLPCENGKSYCEGHAKVAYQPVTSRRDREKSKKRIITSGGSLISRF